ncbi:hypothetical protein TNCV_1731181 [Trichonephila clavipes]|nr:hypothetical protein TNCV_1731181 [Trichonephila clavipes]
MEVNYNALGMNLEKIKDEEHQWLIYGDFKTLIMFLSQQYYIPKNVGACCKEHDERFYLDVRDIKEALSMKMVRRYTS